METTVGNTANFSYAVMLCAKACCVSFEEDIIKDVACLRFCGRETRDSATNYDRVLNLRIEDRGRELRVSAIVAARKPFILITT